MRATPRGRRDSRATRRTSATCPASRCPPALAIEAGLASVRARRRRARRDAGRERCAALVDALARRRRARAAACALSKGFVATDAAARRRADRTRRSRRAGRRRWASISGPSFAVEVARGLPTARGGRRDRRRRSRETSAALLRGDTLRVYASDDLAGVEMGGAVKNVLAIAAGASDGLGFGHNARAALITRGLAETGRLVRGAGRPARHADGPRRARRPRADLHRRPVAQPAGGPRARARRAARRDPCSGSATSPRAWARPRAARALARIIGVDMPIIEAVHRVLDEGVAPARAVEELLRREPRGERESRLSPAAPRRHRRSRSGATPRTRRPRRRSTG